MVISNKSSIAPKRKEKAPDLTVTDVNSSVSNSANISDPSKPDFTIKAPSASPLGTATAPTPHQTVSFNSDKTVNVNGKNYSPEAYKTFLSAQSGEGSSDPTHKGQVIDLLKGQQQVEQSIANPQPDQAQLDSNLSQIQSPQDINGQVGQPGTDNALEYGGAAVVGGVGAILGAAGAGATIGAVAGPVGVAIGAILGGAGAFFSKVSLDERQQTKEAYTNYKNAKKGFTMAQNLANAGRKEEALQMWTTNKRNMLIAQAQLKQKTRTAVGRQLSAGMDEYSTVNDYLENYLPASELSFAMALSQPNPSAIVPILDDPLEQQ